MTRSIETPAQYEAYRREAFDFLWNEVEPKAAAMERGGGPRPRASSPASPSSTFFACSCRASTAALA